MPTLYVVATPIGNLSDMSPRAVETLKNVGLIAAEDTRVTMKLTTHFGISTPLTSCHQHNEDSKGPQLARRMLEENMDVALTTDAGTPGISDPGYGLAAACVALGIPVVAVPGPVAMAAALSISGMDVREFAFYGFLPREKKDLQAKLLSMARGVKIAVVHESPYRVMELMETIEKLLPETTVSVSCDLTKLHELTLRGTVGEVRARMAQNAKTEKGEYCIVLNFERVMLPAEKQPSPLSLEARLLEAMLSGQTLRDAQAALQADGEKKNAVYAAALKVKEFINGVQA